MSGVLACEPSESSIWLLLAGYTGENRPGLWAGVPPTVLAPVASANWSRELCDGMDENEEFCDV